MNFSGHRRFVPAGEQSSGSSSSGAGSGYNSQVPHPSQFDNHISTAVDSPWIYGHYGCGPRNNQFDDPASNLNIADQPVISSRPTPFYGSTAGRAVSGGPPGNIYLHGSTAQHCLENQRGSETYETPPTPDSRRDVHTYHAAENVQGPIASDTDLDLQGLGPPFDVSNCDITTTATHAATDDEHIEHTCNIQSCSTTAAHVGHLLSEEPSWSSVNLRNDHSFPNPDVVVFAPSPGVIYDTYHRENVLQGSDRSHSDQITEETIPFKAHSIDDDLRDPWNHVVPRHVFLDSLSPLSIGTTSTCVSKGGRPPGFHFDDAGAQNAKQMRKDSVCWHCRLVRKKCSPGEPCQPCQDISARHGFRKFSLPCFRDKLHERADMLLPDSMTSHLKRETVLEFVRNNVGKETGIRFQLPLTLGYGSTFSFDAWEFVPNPANTELTHSIGVEIDAKSQTTRRVMRETACLCLFLASDFVQKSVSSWLDEIIFTNLRGWPVFFCGNVGVRWQLGVLEAVCEYFTDHVRILVKAGIHRSEWPDELVTLRRALKLWVLMFLMSHQLVIPETQRQWIEELLDITLPEGSISPRLINKIVKSILRPMVSCLATNILAGLDASFRGKKGTRGAWGAIFSSVVLLITVAADIEVSLDDIAACAIARGDLSRSRTEAVDDIEQLEEKVPDVIIGLFHARFSFNPFKEPQDGGIAESDAPVRRLICQISIVVAQDRLWNYPWPKLNEMQQNEQLATFNSARLLSKFLTPFFKHFETPKHSSMVVGRRYGELLMA